MSVNQHPSSYQSVSAVNPNDMSSLHQPLQHPTLGAGEGHPYQALELGGQQAGELQLDQSSTHERSKEPFQYFTAGDLSAFVALVTNNMATLLVVVTAVKPYLGPDIVWGRLVPGVGWATLFGNLYYTWMAWRMRRQEGRNDICAQPYGINTPGAFAFAFSIMIPAVTGMCPNNPQGADYPTECQERGWQIGIGANLIASFILICGAIIGKWIAKNVPLVPLFTSLSSIAIAYLCFGSLTAEFQYPLIGLFCLAVFFIEYFGDVKFFIPGTNIRMPASILILVLGSAIGWADGLVSVSDIKASKQYIQGYAPVFTLIDMFKHIDLVKGSLSIIVPTAITVAVGTIQCVQMAHEAGDRYSVRDSMIGDGLGTLIASITGSPLGMTVFIGHPGFKRMGARTGYSVTAAIAFWALCVFGLLAPLNDMISAAAVNPILVAIGLDISAETAKITPHRHLPAFLFGLFPSLANWAMGNGDSGDAGIVNLGNGALLVSMFITAMLMNGIDRKFDHVAIWASVAAVLSFFGLIHSSQVGWLTDADDMSWRFAIGYCMIIVMSLFALLMQRMGSIEPVRPEAIKEQFEAERKTQELEDDGHASQPNFCCGCV